MAEPWSSAKANALLFQWLCSPEAAQLLGALADGATAAAAIAASKGVVDPSLAATLTVASAAVAQHVSSSAASSTLSVSGVEASLPHLLGKTLTQSSPQRLLRKNLDANLAQGATSTGNLYSPTPVSNATTAEDAVLGLLSPGGSTRKLQRKPSNRANLSLVDAEAQVSIPKFFEPGVGALYRREVSDSLVARQKEIAAFFENHPEGVRLDEFGPICRDMLGWPMSFCVPLFRRIRLLSTLRVQRSASIAAAAARAAAQSPNSKSPTSGDFAVAQGATAQPQPPSPSFQSQPPLPPTPPPERPQRRNDTVPYNPAYISEEELAEWERLEQGVITETEFSMWWKAEVEPYDRMERFFRLVKQPEADVIHAEDFFPFVRTLIDHHPGLEFLEGTPEFQEKYARTVVARIIYRTNTTWTGDITLREIRRSDLLEYFALVDRNEEINDVNEYFSYEHFYVIYCKFWELDTDHDFLITRDDLLRYGGHSLTVGIVDRVFQEPARPFRSRVKGRMGFEDFVWFILDEEDKTNSNSVRFWFACVDLDGDGFIRRWEIRHFYEEQLRRMQSLGQEEVSLKDFEAQLLDCLLGERTGARRSRRARRIRVGGGSGSSKDSMSWDDASSTSSGAGVAIQPYSPFSTPPNSTPPSPSSTTASPAWPLGVLEEEPADGHWALSLADFLEPSVLPLTGHFYNLLFNLNKFVTHENRDPFTAKQIAEEGGTDWDRYALAEYARLAGIEEERSANAAAAASTSQVSDDRLASAAVQGVMAESLSGLTDPSIVSGESDEWTHGEKSGSGPGAADRSGLSDGVTGRMHETSSDVDAESTASSTEDEGRGGSSGIGGGKRVVNHEDDYGEHEHEHEQDLVQEHNNNHARGENGGIMTISMMEWDSGTRNAPSQSLSPSSDPNRAHLSPSPMSFHGDTGGPKTPLMPAFDPLTATDGERELAKYNVSTLWGIWD